VGRQPDIEILEGLSGDRDGPAGADEKIASTAALRTFFIAVVAGREAGRTLFPIAVIEGAGVVAVAALAGDGSAATAVCDSYVVAGTATFGAAGYGLFSLHNSMIRHLLVARLIQYGKSTKAAHWWGPEPSWRYN
jgi:hypothetical protein